MAYTPKEGSGSIFPSERKDKDTQPDWRGDFMLNGARYRMAMWDRDTGGKSMKIEPYQEREQSQTSRKEPSKAVPAPAASYDKPFEDTILF